MDTGRANPSKICAGIFALDYWGSLTGQDVSQSSPIMLPFAQAASLAGDDSDFFEVDSDLVLVDPSDFAGVLAAEDLRESVE